MLYYTISILLNKYFWKFPSCTERNITQCHPGSISCEIKTVSEIKDGIDNVERVLKGIVEAATMIPRTMEQIVSKIEYDLINMA